MNESRLTRTDRFLKFLVIAYVVFAACKYYTPQQSWQFMSNDPLIIIGSFFRIIASAGILIVPLVFLFKREKLLKFLYLIIAPAYLISIGFMYSFINLQGSFNIDSPMWFLISTNVLEVLLFSAIFAFSISQSGFKVGALKEGLGEFLLITLGLLPMQLFNRFEANVTTDFFQVQAFDIWHLLAVFLGLGLCLVVYFGLRKKDKEEIWNSLFILSLIMIVHYIAKNSVIMSMPNGFKGITRLDLNWPAHICDWGTIIAPFAIGLRKKFLLHVMFFINAVGAMSIFFYLEVYNANVFAYNYIFFVVMHALLYILSIGPVIFGLMEVEFKKYFGKFLVFFVGMVFITLPINHYFFVAHSWVMNYAFTLFPPMPIFNFGDWFLHSLFGIRFNAFYFSFILLFYFFMIFAHYGLYLLFRTINRRNKAKVRIAEAI